MKIAIRGGHSLDVRGATGIIDEVTEDRKIAKKVIEYLKQLGHEVLDVTPGNSGSSATDLSVPVQKANDWGAEYFASIHLNSGGGHGTEVLYKSSKGKAYAEKIVNKLASLGFTNRGAKSDVRNLYEFRAVSTVNNIIEVLFLDSQSDVDLYNKLGVDRIAIAICEGITGQVISSDNPNQNNEQERNGFNVLFVESYYLKTYPDVAAAVANGGIQSGKWHYDHYGKAEGRRAYPELPHDFCEGDYLDNNPDVKDAVVKGYHPCGAEHWMIYGWNEKRKYTK